MKNILSIVATIVLSLSASVAFACNGNPPPNCSCKNNQWVDNTTNNVYNNTTNNVVNGINGNVSSNSAANSASSSNATGGSATATGGQGGAGGSVKNSGNSSNVNNVTGGNSSASIAAGAVQNKNSNSQKQNQTQTSNSTVSNSGNSSATGGTVANSGNATIAAGAVSNNVSASGNGSNNETNASASADGAGANNGNNSNNTEINTTYKAAKIPVATAYAASLTSGFDTCLGSTSGGVQTQILGLSIGGTHIDKNCILIKQTQLLREMGLDGAACFRARMHKEGADIDEAMKLAGITCRVVEPVVVTKEVIKEVPGPTVTVIKEVEVKKPRE